jgi:hypothetical protein
MSHLYNSRNLEHIGQDIGKNILELKKHHDKFWINLDKKNNDKHFKMVGTLIVLIVGCLFEVIWYNSFQLIFGSLTPVRFPFGLIKLLAYSFGGYFIGFEIGWFYTRYIYKLLELNSGVNNIKKLIEEVKVKKPIKKRSLSDVEDYCNGKFCECENLFTCDKKKREIKKDN